jgi:hypothetical protein
MRELPALDTSRFTRRWALLDLPHSSLGLLIMAITNHHLHVVAHTARMIMVLAEKPDHPRKSEYDRQLRIYRGQWAELEADEKQLVAATVIADPDAADLTDETVAAAVALLEG